MGHTATLHMNAILSIPGYNSLIAIKKYAIENSKFGPIRTYVKRNFDYNKNESMFLCVETRDR